MEKGTGKNWGQWLTLLEKHGGSQLERRDLVAWLRQKYKLSEWWVQIVATGYEIHLGRRMDGWNQKGEYSITATKSLAVGADDVWKFLISPRGIALWLKPLSPFHLRPGESFENEDGIFGQLRTVKAGRRLRLTWQDSDWDRKSILQINIVPKPKGKSILVFQQEQLRQGRLRESLRQHWRKILAEIAKEVTTVSKSEGSDPPRSGRRRRTRT